MGSACFRYVERMIVPAGCKHVKRIRRQAPQAGVESSVRAMKGASPRVIGWSVSRISTL